MRKHLLLLFLLGMTISFSNCTEEEEEDLTVDIIGEYIGAYGNNSTGEINPYTLVVVKVDNNNISVKPKVGTEFSGVEIALERFNSSTISSPTDSQQQLEKSAVFTIGMPVAFAMSLDPTGEAHTFVGEKQ